MVLESFSDFRRFGGGICSGTGSVQSAGSQGRRERGGGGAEGAQEGRLGGGGGGAGGAPGSGLRRFEGEERKGDGEVLR